MLLFGPINILNDLLLKANLSEQTINYFVWPLIQIGLASPTSCARPNSILGEQRFCQPEL